MKAIVAITENRVIGYRGGIPWRLPEDLRFFREVTWGATVIMGRRTYDSIGHPLPGRENVVLTRKGGLQVARNGVLCTSDLKVIARLCKQVEKSGGEVFVVGGAGVYKALLPLCNEIFVTHVKGYGSLKEDTFFPPFEKEFDSKAFIRENRRMRIVHYLRRGPKNEGRPGLTHRRL
ncbi:MAG: dihydrofolate reductase [Candidatus Xiphinematobacter sp.]|nr:MAG: dihydrofolate reductase [Candidatus Xiphinematobacter sp.]QQY11007.1 MAG: dihydrofolate reductase [Candidatus Xiphinematobacter sp.]